MENWNISVLLLWDLRFAIWYFRYCTGSSFNPGLI